MPVRFHSQTPFRLTHKKRLKIFIEGIFVKEKKNMESVSFIFCTDTYLLGINRQFLGHDYFTDIITFNLASPKSPVIGDIYISIERVRENAKSLGQNHMREMHRVIFHGVLHLCGYKDKLKKDIICMRERENRYLDLYLS